MLEKGLSAQSRTTVTNENTAAGKAGLAALADPGRPDLKQQVQSIRTLYQRTQNSIFVSGFQQRGNMIAVKPAQICQFFSHSSIVKARWQLVMSTVG